MSRFLQGLNSRQLEAASSTEGPVLALAGAGTGKTHTVISRIAHIISGGVDPENVLAVTFTNKAAGELKERLKKALGKQVDLSRMIASTFHSLCVQLIRRDAAALGYKQSFSIADQGEQHAIIRKAARFVHGGQNLKPEDILAEISRIKSRGLTPQQYAMRALDDAEQTVASVYRRYQDALRLCNSMDFDDLLLKSLELLQKHAPAREYWQERFRYIMVDEFQDTSEIQYKLVTLLAGKWKNICVVGDDDQSIYSWRGAVASNILDFPAKWFGAKVVYLEENYRSTNAILRAANAVIANNTQRHAKTLWSSLGDGEPVRLLEMEDQEQEAELIVDEIRRGIKDGRRASDYAIILRANALTRPFEAAFKLERIPHEVIGGQSFFDRKEVRDMLSYLAAVENPQDDGAVLRIINTPARGIGEKTVEHLIEQAGKTHRPLTQVLAHANAVEGLAAAAIKACAEFADMLNKWRAQLRESGVERLVETIIRDTKYEEEVEHLYDDPLLRTARMESAFDVGESLRRHFQDGGRGGLGAFLQEAMLSWREKGDKNQPVDAVKLITIHSAKGLEYPYVYIAGVEEKIIPHRNSEEEGNVDEERRLFYVAMTRARRELTLSYCASRIMRGQKSPRVPSRFLSEVPPELLQRSRPAPLDAEEKADAIANISEMLKGL